MGKVVSINVCLKNIWDAWFAFRRGKKPTPEMEQFSYYLEDNLSALQRDLRDGTYHHGAYHAFTVMDNKRRVISVANIRDRVVHRLLYDYLIFIYNDSFYYDVWSCRLHKGLIGAIERVQKFARASPRVFVWRTDITKFFNNVNCATLMDILKRKIFDPKALWLLQEIIDSFDSGSKGIPIGNLTSQIFANIYLNELDRFVVHTMKPKHYLRYGDDFLVFHTNKDVLISFREKIIAHLKDELDLVINPKHDIIVQAKDGLYFLGVEVYPNGRRLCKRNWLRVKNRLNPLNIGSYNGLVLHHSKEKKINEFHWRVMENTQTE